MVLRVFAPYIAGGTAILGLGFVAVQQLRKLNPVTGVLKGGEKVYKTSKKAVVKTGKFIGSKATGAYKGGVKTTKKAYKGGKKQAKRAFKAGKKYTKKLVKSKTAKRATRAGKKYAKSAFKLANKAPQVKLAKTAYKKVVPKKAKKAAKKAKRKVKGAFKAAKRWF